MLKSIKDARRRSVESVLEAVGVAQHTVDEEFEHYHKNFTEMVEDLNECGAAYTTLLVQQKKYFHESVEMVFTIFFCQVLVIVCRPSACSVSTSDTKIQTTGKGWTTTLSALHSANHTPPL